MKPFKIFLFVTSLLIAFLCQGQDSLSLLFIGDVMQHEAQIWSAYNRESQRFEYDSCFQYLKEEMSDADLTIANLEFTLGGKPYKGYPMFSAPDETAVALKNAGVDILVTANNHTCDRRKRGVIRTLDVLDSLGIAHTGSFRNQAEKELAYPMLIEKNGFRLALLNYTYGTNGMPIEEPTRVNLIREDDIIADLAKAKTLLVDKIIVFMHWGSEYTHKPNAQQEKIARLLFDQGADIIIGAHPHVLQPMYHYRNDSTDRMIAYSLGNFISYQRRTPKDGGAMVRIELVKEEDAVRIHAAGYLFTWVWMPTQEGRKKFYVLPASKYETDADMIDTASHAKMMRFVTAMRNLLQEKNEAIHEYIFSPEKGWYLPSINN
jgi:poly-gamma-glutamate synthesis protein (capsule biosynthesis protein)